MSYLALYRKMRPKNFDQIVGQEHIVKTLRNQIKSDRISHAYLFCGTRGTGKTSIAKIFAKAINCINPDNGQPCGKCEICQRIESAVNMNVIEIDAASNNSVENIRDIRDEVKYPPTEGRFKVYIIDEVHMLSVGAFNALLKTLEEPPAHIVFILATTDPQKIPVTIHSRCQRFDFKRISAKQIGDTLKEYMKMENIAVTDDAVSYIASAADGAMRDALSIMDQCTSFYFGEEITLSKVLDVCGAVDTNVFFKMTDALFEQDGQKCMEIINEVSESGRDIIQFVNDIIVHFRNVIVARTVSDESYTLEFSKENSEKYRKQGEKIDKNFLIELINIFSELQYEIKYSSNPKVILEVECIKICNPINPENIEQLKAQIRSIEKRLEKGIPALEQSPIESSLKENSLKENNALHKAKPKPIPEDMKTAAAQWKQFAENFKISEKYFLLRAKPNILDEKFYIVCSSKQDFERITKLKSEIEEKLKMIYQKDFIVFISTEKDFNLKCSEFDMSGVKTDFEEEEEINSKLSGVIWD